MRKSIGIIRFIANNDLNKSIPNEISKKTRKQIIQNANLPKCTDCFFFNPKYDYNKQIIPHRSICFKYANSNIVSGQIEYNLAKENRELDEKCGLNGKYFEPK
jgi:hypothetical protein